MKLKKYLPIILILLTAGFIRFKTTHLLMTFTPDEAYETYLAQTIIKNFHIIWIGLSAGSFGLFLGPLWIYFISPFLSLSKGDPLILGYLGSLMGIISVALLYYLSLQLFNKKVAIIASCFYAFLPLMTFYDQKAYPTGVSFLSILMALSLYLTKKSKYWWLVFSASYALVFHVHLSLLPMILVGAFWLLTHKNSIDKKTFILSVLIFIAIISPLIMFDYFHKGSNILSLVDAAKSTLAGHSKPQVAYHFKNLSESLGRIWYLPPFKNSSDEILWPCTFTKTSTYSVPLLITSLISFASFFYFIFRKFRSKSEEKKLLIALSLSFIIPFIFTSLSNPIEYYLLGFFPILFIIVAVCVESFKSIFRKILYVFIFLFCILGIRTVLTAKGDYGLLEKETIIGSVAKIIGKNSYELIEAGDCHRYEGWRYLFTVHNLKPSQSPDDDAIFSWLYPNEIQTKTNYTVTINESRSINQLDPKYDYKFVDGGFTVFVKKNF